MPAGLHLFLMTRLAKTLVRLSPGIVSMDLARAECVREYMVNRARHPGSHTRLSAPFALHVLQLAADIRRMPSGLHVT